MSTNNDHKIKIYLGRMSHLQESILNFINTQGQAESQYQEIISFFKTHKIGEDRNELQSILHLILKISNNHHRNPDFFSKIERLFTNFKEEMKIYFSNYEIFQFFKSNKRLLLFLFKEGIIKPDKQIACFITNYKYQQAYYPHFFLPEFKNLFDEITLKNINETIQTLNQNQQTQVDDKNSFDQKRQIGENDHILYELIRNDSIDQFTSLVTEKNLPLSSTIEPSIFETNSFLINQKPTLIEYAAFFGSLKIFNFLRSKEIELTPSLWNFAIHGENLEILKILVDKKINPQNDSFKDVFIESIKCHHNQIAKLIQINKKELNLNDISTQSIKYYNYSFFPTEIKCDEIKTLCDFCKYNYFQVVSFLLESNKIPINSQSILKI